MFNKDLRCIKQTIINCSW